MALGAEGTDKRLVAWVVPKEWNSPPSAAAVRAFLKDHLPNIFVHSVAAKKSGAAKEK